MIKIWVSLMLVYLLIFTAAPVLAGSRPVNQQDESLEQIRIKIARLGIGEKARVTIKLKNGTKIKGYIDQTKSDEFILKDRNTGAPLNILYSDVSRVESNRGHSTAKAIALGAAATFGVLLGLAFIGAAIGD